MVDYDKHVANEKQLEHQIENLQNMLNNSQEENQKYKRALEELEKHMIDHDKIEKDNNVLLDEIMDLKNKNKFLENELKAQQYTA